MGLPRSLRRPRQHTNRSGHPNSTLGCGSTARTNPRSSPSSASGASAIPSLSPPESGSRLTRDGGELGLSRLRLGSSGGAARGSGRTYRAASERGYVIALSWPAQCELYAARCSPARTPTGLSGSWLLMRSRWLSEGRAPEGSFRVPEVELGRTCSRLGLRESLARLPNALSRAIDARVLVPPIRRPDLAKAVFVPARHNMQMQVENGLLSSRTRRTDQVHALRL